MLKKNLLLALWLGLVNLPFALYLGNAYCPSFEYSTWYALVAFYAASIGHYFLYFALFSLLLISPIMLIKQEGMSKWRFVYGTAILSVLHIVLATDAQVYGIYRFHINATVLDLFFNGGNEVIKLGLETWLFILGKVALCVAYSALALFAARLLVLKGFKSKLWVAVPLCLYLGANLAHAYAAAALIYPIMDLKNSIPLYRPFTMNKVLTKMGVIEHNDASRKIQATVDGKFDYPKQTLTYADDKVSAPYNVVLILVDTLRFDMLNPKDMPHTWEFAKDAWVFDNYYSASNATAGGVFGLFYGIPSTYWKVAQESGVPAAISSVIYERSYKYGIFSSANVYKPEFNETVFANVPNLRMSSKGDRPYEHDLDAIHDFKEFLSGLKPQEKFFSLVYLDAVHGYDYPDDFKEQYVPAKPYNYMKISKDLDRTPFWNRYRNAANYTDINMQGVYEMLSEYGYDDNTIVIITADHGESFNDDNDNYWGHSSNFRDYQVKVPLVVKWPGMGAKHVDTRAVAYDVTATLLPRVFGVQNPTKDYSIGQDLFELKERPYLYLCAYTETAILEKDRIVVANKEGFLSFKDKFYKPSQDTSRNSFILEGLELSSYYLEK